MRLIDDKKFAKDHKMQYITINKDLLNLFLFKIKFNS